MRAVREFTQQHIVLLTLLVSVVLGILWFFGAISEDSAAIVLAILALVYAAHQYTDASKERQGLEQLRGQLAAAVRELRQGLSTRYLGEFPEFLDSIVTLLESARSDIAVLCDYPAYGVFSNPDGYKKYLTSVCQQSGVLGHDHVHLVHFDRTHRLKRHGTQLGLLGGWDEFRGTHGAELTRFVELYGDAGAKVPTSEEAFTQLIESAQTQALTALRSAGATVDDDVSGPMPICFWMADGKQAIFSLPQFSEALEVAFRTEDAALIAALDNIFETSRPDSGASGT